MSITKSFGQRDDFGNFEANIGFLHEAKVIVKSSKILEIGCGKGRLLNYFYRKAYDITGIEKNESLVAECKKLYGNLPLASVGSEVLPFNSSSFDVVISFDVFEHIPNSDKHLKEVNRVLRNGGYYLLQTPNKLTNVVFETIRWRSFTKWRAVHCALHTYWEIRKRFEKNGFGISFYDYPIVNAFFKQKLNYYLGKLGLTLLSVINPDRLPCFLKTNFYIKALKIRNIT